MVLGDWMTVGFLEIFCIYAMSILKKVLAITFY